MLNDESLVLRVHSLRLLQLVLGLNQIHYLIVLLALLQVLLEEQELLPLEPLLERVLLELIANGARWTGQGTLERVLHLPLQIS